jgi:hypothetical protein
MMSDAGIVILFIAIGLFIFFAGMFAGATLAIT